MKKYLPLFLAVFVMISAGCKKGPDLVVENAQIDFAAKTVTVVVGNVGTQDAGNHLTYIEINQVNAPDSATPEAQYSSNVAGIVKGGTWNSGPIPFSSFSTRHSIDLNSLTAANLVVRADAKGMVKESNENNNLYDADH